MIKSLDVGKEVVRRLRFISWVPEGFFPLENGPLGSREGGPLPISSFKPWIEE